MSRLRLQRPSAGREEMLADYPETTKQETRQTAYRDMLHYAGRVIGYAEQAIPELANFGGESLEDYIRARTLAEKLSRAIDLLRRVMDQTERPRVQRRTGSRIGENCLFV